MLVFSGFFVTKKPKKWGYASECRFFSDIINIGRYDWQQQNRQSQETKVRRPILRKENFKQPSLGVCLNGILPCHDGSNQYKWIMHFINLNICKASSICIVPTSLNHWILIDCLSVTFPIFHKTAICIAQSSIGFPITARSLCSTVRPPCSCNQSELIRNRKSFDNGLNS